MNKERLNLIRSYCKEIEEINDRVNALEKSIEKILKEEEIELVEYEKSNPESKQYWESTGELSMEEEFDSTISLLEYTKGSLFDTNDSLEDAAGSLQNIIDHFDITDQEDLI